MGEYGKCFINQRIIVNNEKDKFSFRSKEQSPLYCFYSYEKTWANPSLVEKELKEWEMRTFGSASCQELYFRINLRYGKMN